MDTDEDEGSLPAAGLAALKAEIEGREQAEQQTRRQERFVESIVENLPDMIFVKDAAELRFVRFNRAGEELLGHRREDLYGKNDHDFFPADEADFFTAKDREVLRSGRVFEIAEEPIHTRDRGVRLLHTKKIPILDEQGRPEYLLGISEDITERRRAEEQLKAIVHGTGSAVGKNFFDELVRHLSAALDVPIVFACTLQGDPPDASRTLAIWQDGKLGEGFEYALAGTPCHEVARNQVCVHLGGLPERFPDDRWLAEVGAETYIGVPFVSSSGEVAGHLGIVDTRRREDHAQMGSTLQVFANRAVAELERARAEQALIGAAEELGRSNAELEQFAYVASHDLQEPLRKIIAFGKLLPEACGALPPTARDYLDRMLGAADRMQSLISDLLVYSRVNTQPRVLTEVDLGEVLREVLIDLEVAISEGRAQITVGALPVLLSDRLQMRQLLQNLVGNAVKFHKPGEPAVVAVSSRPIEGRVELSVADQGIGLDEKYADRIFKPFQRLHARREYQGTGIGLAICKRIADHHGGSIRVTSAPGEGATFVVAFPAAIGRP